MNTEEEVSDWEIVAETESYKILMLPSDEVVLKDNQYFMNYALYNNTTKRVEALFPTEVGAISTIRDMEVHRQALTSQAVPSLSKEDIMTILKGNPEEPPGEEMN